SYHIKSYHIKSYHIISNQIKSNLLYILNVQKKNYVTYKNYNFNNIKTDTSYSLL
ncbi:hypothetical protein PFFCH_04647, partial [Plasmodium falciparum FCH/4]